MSEEATRKIDENLDAILKASGSSLKHYTMPFTLENMRAAMRKIMLDSYVKGSDDAVNLAKERVTQ